MLYTRVYDTCVGYMNALEPVNQTCQKKTQTHNISGPIYLGFKQDFSTQNQSNSDDLGKFERVRAEPSPT